MYLPPSIAPGQTAETIGLNIGRQYLFTVTGFAAGETAVLEFLHGSETVWTPIAGSEATEATSFPFYCPGPIRIVTTGTTALNVSINPIIIADY